MSVSLNNLLKNQKLKDAQIEFLTYQILRLVFLKIG